MPPTFRTAPRSPVLVRKQCSPQSPYRLSCAGNEPASFQSFVMVSTFSMVPRDAYLDRLPLHGVVALAEFGGVEEDAEDLDIVFRRNPRDDDADNEEADAAEERVQEREDRAAADERNEEQPPLRAQYGQRAVHRLINFVLS